MREKSERISKLLESKKSRDAYTRAVVNLLVPAQIKALRQKENLTQTGLAKLADMLQSRISAMEKPGATLNVETLIRVASAFKVGLKIEFVPFSTMLNWENSFNLSDFDVTPIDKDVEFTNPTEEAGLHNKANGAVELENYLEESENKNGQAVAMKARPPQGICAASQGADSLQAAAGGQ